MSGAEEFQRILAERAGDVIFVAGGGMATAAGLPSWTELLRSGLRRVHTRGRIEAEELALFERQLTFTSPTARAAVADVVKHGLPDDEFSQWLRETFDRDYRAGDHGHGDVLAALATYERRGAKIATTNFDTLLEASLGLAAVTSREPEAVRMLDGDERRVLHFHGVWDRPETVVLGEAEYSKVLASASRQFSASLMPALRTFVFVGCGARREDPNVEGLLRWVAAASPMSRHYRLVSRSQQAALAAEDTTAAGVISLVHDDDDLAELLRRPLALASFQRSHDAPAADERVIAEYLRRLGHRVGPMRALWAGSGASPEALESLFVEPRLALPRKVPRGKPASRGPEVEHEVDPADRTTGDEPIEAVEDTAPAPWRERLPGPGRPGVLLLGELGAGKSTALRIVVRRMCRGGKGLPDYFRGKVPVWVELAAFARELAGGRPPSTLLRHAAQAESGLPEAVLRSLDAAGRLVWLLDGLDEVIGEPLRAEVIAAIEALVAEGGSRWVLVTSRPHPAPLLSPRFERHELVPWDDDSILSLARGYYRVIQPAADIEERARRVLAALQANVVLYELCQWPLFLGLVLSLGHAGEVPWPRHRLYRRALELILDEWDVASHVAPVKLASDDKLAFLRRVAWAMLQRGQIALPRAQVVRLAEEFFATFDEPRASAATLASSLVDDLCRRGSLLAPTEDGSLSFSHRAWLDYAAARELHSRRETERELFAARWNDPLWSGALLVAVGLLAEESLAEVVPLLHAVLRSRPTLATSVLVRPLTFVVRALGYCVHLRREPMLALGRALTAYLLALGVDDVTLGVRAALRESGPHWPGAEILRGAVTDEWSGLLALSVCGLEHRAEILIRALERCQDPARMVWLLRAGRQIGPWRAEELRRLLAIDSAFTFGPGPLLRSDMWSLHVAAGLLELEPLPEALEYVQTRLHADIVEVRAYAALVLLRASRSDPEILEVLAAAIHDDVWTSYVPGPIRMLLANMVAKILQSSSRPVGSRLHQILSGSRSKLLRARVSNPPETAPMEAPEHMPLPDDWSSPDSIVRYFLDLPADVPLTESLIAQKLADVEPGSGLNALESLAELDLVPPSGWRAMALQLAERCEEPEEFLRLAILLGDREALRRLAEDVATAHEASVVLRQAEQLDAVLRVGRLRRGRVLLAGRFAGVLDELPGARTRFTYAPAYVTDAQARPLAPTMRLRDEPYERDGLHTYFANLLPQGALLELKARTHSLSASDAFGLLLALGADLPGAVEVFEDEEWARCPLA